MRKLKRAPYFTSQSSQLNPRRGLFTIRSQYFLIHSKFILENCRFCWFGVAFVTSLGALAALLTTAAYAGPPKGAGRYRLVFTDEFDSLDLGTTEDRSQSQAHRWYEGVWFSHAHAPRQRFQQSNSALSISWQRGQPQPDSSISTFARGNPRYHAWRYGYFEARMKWQPVAGAWPAFWLIPVEAAQSSAPSKSGEESGEESGEIDIFEGQGTEPHTFFGTLHHWNGSHEVASTSRRNRFPLPATVNFAGYHNYGLLWLPGQVTWYFDGVALHAERTYEIFDKQTYMLILGMQEGADWKAGDLNGVAAQSLQLIIDWVHVWQKE